MKRASTLLAYTLAAAFGLCAATAVHGALGW